MSKQTILDHNARIDVATEQVDNLPTYENLDAELDTQEALLDEMGEALAGKCVLPTQDKEVTAGVEQMTVTADENYSLGNVVVNPTPTVDKEVTASTEAMTVSADEGSHLGDVLVNPTPTQSKTVTPSDVEQTVTPDDGYHLGEVIVESSGTPYSGDNPLTIGEEGATIPANTVIKEALQILCGEVGIPIPTGFTKYAVDTFTLSSLTSVNSQPTLNHSLGVVPKAVILIGEVTDTSYYCYSRLIGDAQSAGNTSGSFGAIAKKGTSLGGTTGTLRLSATTVIPATSDSYYLQNGITYTLITLR